ncbi:uncharacterized protein TM35_000212750 [Trypanosoma theileri]|uniref:Uncharacterized protein n=1 Tax=Trypanosoma theileri TaxID=67003 RepID=A0A1X0NU11_9TRYP|nr:uncharacterized protein TM35_000212750 [Trypanosoma theileri]ORC87669.1 hypothetical protein TM35_000212750 [Trypanosoma theileri]
MKQFASYSRFLRRRTRRRLLRPFVLLVLFLFLYAFSKLFFRGSSTPNEVMVIENETEMETETENSAMLNVSGFSNILLYEEKSELWGFTGGIESLLEKGVPRKYWGPIMRRSHEGSLDEWSVNNMTGMRLTESTVAEEEMRLRYIQHRKVRDATGCDTLSVPFNPRRDSRCIQFMTTPSNWKELIPISQSVDQRTIKFAIQFKSVHVADGEIIDDPIETIIKVPQRPFPSEAAGEVGAFHADRILLINRVPPTGWACLPLQMIKNSVSKYKDSVNTTAMFLRMSGVKNYEDWVQKDLFDFARTSRSIEWSKDGNCIGVSIQLKISDVGHFLASAMRIPYDAHTDTWHDYFNLNIATKESMEELTRARSYIGVLHLAEINMFDYIVGNMDRSPNKNNFVVGGTHLEPSTDKKFMLHPNHPTFIYLDHGMAFYRRHPRRNPLTKSIEAFKKGLPDTFCFFRGPLLRRIRDLMEPSGRKKGETIFAFRMKQRLPNRVYSIIGSSGLRFCSMRGKELLGVAERCLANDRIQRYVLFP